jgi:hypothetical protein
LKRATDLQNRSASIPTPLPFTIFSVDKKAQLDISAGTTVVLNGKDVQYIEVQQSYPNEVVAKNIPVEKENKEIKKREDIPYVIDNPIYSFEPSGLLFNQLQKLSLYYADPQGKDAKGVGILKGENGFWVPMPSEEDRANRKVFANIIGFTQFTAIFCESQKLKNVVARQVFEPNTGCYVTLVISVIAIIFAFVVIVGVAAAAAAGVAGAGGTTVGLGTATTSAISSFGGLGGAFGAGLNTLGLESLGALVLQAPFAVGIGLSIFSFVSYGLSITGAATEAFYSSSPENCQGFVPTCTWQVGIDTVTKDGEGKCSPKEGTMKAGVPALLCAQVEKCNFIEKFTCQSCSVECTAQFY